MTNVRVRIHRPSATGVIPSGGSLEFTPTRAVTVGGVPQTLVLPAPFVLPLTAEEHILDLTPNGAGWAWQVRETFPGVATTIRVLAVPSTVNPADIIDYTALAEVDPSTLAPLTNPSTPLWFVYVDGLEAEALASKNAALAAQSAATGSQTSAANSATAAAGSATASANSATASANSATSSSGAATAAATSASAASAARTGAETAKGQAEIAQGQAAAQATAASGSATAAANSATAASGSATAAQTARTGSETAKTASEAARDVAIANATGFSVGTVTTVPTGGAATAAITGAAPNRKLDLGLPRGATGATPNISIGTVTTGNAPQTTVGPTGLTGPQGVQGNPGDLVPTASGSVSGAITLTTAEYPSTRSWTLTGNVTLTLPTPAADKSGTITLILTQDATGGRTITWPAAVKWPEAIAQQPAAGASTVSVVHLLWTGTAWLGVMGGKSFA